EGTQLVGVLPLEEEAPARREAGGRDFERSEAHVAETGIQSPERYQPRSCGVQRAPAFFRSWECCRSDPRLGARARSSASSPRSTSSSRGTADRDRCPLTATRGDRGSTGAGTGRGRPRGGKDVLLDRSNRPPAGAQAVRSQ